MKTLDLEPSTWGIVAPLRIDCVKFAQVLSKCGRFLTEINLSMHKFNLDKHVPYYIAIFCPNLKILDLTAVRLTTQDMKQLSRNCAKIETLRLGLTYDYKYELSSFFQMYRNLKELVISRGKFLDESLSELPAGNVRTIILDECSFTDDRSLYLVSRCSNFFFCSCYYCY
jgi:cell fate regulator YaaT (PSP1 superfamily)